jgi:hypothetical protein
MSVVWCVPSWLPRGLSSTNIRQSVNRKQWMCPHDKACIMKFTFLNSIYDRILLKYRHRVYISAGIKWKVTYCLGSMILWEPPFLKPTVNEDSHEIILWFETRIWSSYNYHLIHAMYLFYPLLCIDVNRIHTSREVLILKDMGWRQHLDLCEKK